MIKNRIGCAFGKNVAKAHKVPKTRLMVKKGIRRNMFISMVEFKHLILLPYQYNLCISHQISINSKSLVELANEKAKDCEGE